MFGSGAYSGCATPAGADAVGSNRTQPYPVKYTSGHACAFLLVTVYVPVRSDVPGVKPISMRVGSPASRAITAYAPENCWQKPCLLVRKATSGLLPGRSGVVVYVKPFSDEMKNCCSASALSYSLLAPTMICCVSCLTEAGMSSGRAVYFASQVVRSGRGALQLHRGRLVGPASPRSTADRASS